MKKINITLLAGLVSVSQWAAADLSYTNFSVGYVDGDFVNTDIDGFYLGGSFSINSDIFLLANYAALDANSSDIDRLRFGAGYRIGINQDIDFVTTFSILDFDNGNNSSDGYQLTGGIRGKLNREIEYFADIVKEDIDDFDDDVGIELGARYFFTRENSVGVSIRDVNDIDTFKIDVRFDF